MAALVLVKTRLEQLVGKQPYLYERVMPTHLQILERVIGQDVDGARAAMREHLDIALNIQRELMRGQAI